MFLFSFFAFLAFLSFFIFDFFSFRKMFILIQRFLNLFLAFFDLEP